MKKEICFLLLVIFLFGCEDKEEAAIPIKEVIPEKEEIVEEENITVFPPEQKAIFMVPKGDTITTLIGDEIFLTGIEAPAKGEFCFKESINKLKELVLDKTVTAQRDVSDMNYYGQHLRYVYIDDIFVNEAMVRLGFAKAVAEEPNTNYSDLFYEAEIDAISKRLCLWKNLIADPCLLVAFFSYNAEGVDEYNLNEEFVTFRNICEAKIDLTGWKIQDSAESYIFPEFILGPEAAVTIHSGKGQDTELHLYWGNELSVWHDYSDTLYLSNANGDLILKYRY